MSFFAKCATCHKKKFYIAHRKYIMPQISPKPIRSNEEICGTCFKNIKKITLK